MVSVRNYSDRGCTRGGAWGIGTNAAAACPRQNGDPSDSSVTQFEAFCAVTSCQNLPQWGFDGKQATYCLDHAPLEEGGGHTWGMDDSKGAFRTASSRSRRRVNNNAGGTAAKRARQALPRTVVPVTKEHPPAKPIKAEMILADLC